MKLIKNKKNFNFINIFDFLFILLIVLLSFAAYHRFFLSPDKEVFQNDTKLIYTAKVERIKKEIVDSFKENDLIFMSTAVENEYLKIGTIVDIKVEQYYDILSGLDGKIKEIETPDYYNVIFTIEDDGKFSDGAYYSSENKQLYTNTTMSVATKYTKFEMEIQEIGIKE